mmetsp:Transcript_11801/g.26923  ORF Transcript_11801/g.26923 Transcript_11801/m.26923 type:complete len:332 (+) Transcript_11801:108-1103(+)
MPSRGLAYVGAKSGVAASAWPHVEQCMSGERSSKTFPGKTGRTRFLASPREALLPQGRSSAAEGRSAGHNRGPGSAALSSRVCLARQLAHGHDLGEALGREQEHQHRLLRMKPVLCLIEDNGLRAIDDLRSLLHAAGGRQAVHEDAVWLGKLHEFSIHLKGHEELLPRLLLILRDAVAHPAVAVDDIHVSHSLLGRLEDCDLTTRRLRQLLHLSPDLVLDLAGACKVQVVPHQRGRAHQVVGHVVLEVPEVCHGHALPGPLVLDDGQQVREHLHGMGVVVQRVDHWDRRDVSECPDGSAGLNARGNALAHPGQDPASVLNALLHAQGRVTD